MSEKELTENHGKADQARRRFLTGALAGGVTALGGGLSLMTIAEADYKEKTEPASSKQRWGLLIDTTKCSNGCTDCVDACNEEHGLHGHGRPLSDSQWIRKVELRNKETGSTHSLPMMCQHCTNPPCVDVCPTAASMKRADGIVLVDKHVCIGCRYCMMACPYKARNFIHEELENQKAYAPRGKGTVESCTLCVHRVDNGEQPACVEACSQAGHEALLFGDLKDPSSEIAQQVAKVATTALRADLGLEPGVRYRGI